GCFKDIPGVAKRVSQCAELCNRGARRTTRADRCGRLPRTDDDAVSFELDNIKSGGR
ncbi:hypothetical protein K0M31_012899, partial [Melipona bicolor]